MTSEGFNKKGLCKLCKKPRTAAGHDPCIANLPGVVYACCGHGISYGYLKFDDGRRLRFNPIDMVLDVATHEVVPRPVPVYAEREPYRVLNYKKGKVTGEIGTYRIVGYQGTSVTVRKRKTDK